MSESSKRVTLKSVTSEINKYKALIEKKKSTINTLNQEIKEYEKKIKECEEIKEQLSREQIQKQIEVAWFQGSKISVEHLSKIVELGTQLKDKIGDLNVEDILAAVDMVYDDKKSTQKPEIKEDKVVTGDDKNT